MRHDGSDGKKGRGGFASRNYFPGDLIARIPEPIIIDLDNNGGHAAEHAYELAVRMTADQEFFTFFLPYLSTLPRPNETITSEGFSDVMVKELQSPLLGEMVNRDRATMAAIFQGRFISAVQDGREYIPMSEVFEDPNAFGNILAFRHLTSIIASREFSFATADGSTGPDRLVPVVDMINNDADRVNCDQYTDGENLYLVATKPILKGEELFITYMPGLDHRNDITLTMYGFIRKLDRPLLPATDLPTFNQDSPYQPTPWSDDQLYGPSGTFNTPRELKRLQNLLNSTGTTQEEDEALLHADNMNDWRNKLVLEFRIERKKALRNAIEAIKKELLRTSTLEQLENVDPITAVEA